MNQCLSVRAPAGSRMCVNASCTAGDVSICRQLYPFIHTIDIWIDDGEHCTSGKCAMKHLKPRMGQGGTRPMRRIPSPAHAPLSSAWAREGPVTCCVLPWHGWRGPGGCGRPWYGLRARRVAARLGGARLYDAARHSRPRPAAAGLRWTRARHARPPYHGQPQPPGRPKFD